MHWKHILKTNFHNVPALLEYLQFDEVNKALALEQASFCLNLPLRIAKKMGKNDPFDPLFLQFVPLKKELERSSSFLEDPVQDQTFQKTPRLLQKYEGRVLLVTSGVCAMHCRFCFRQNYDYQPTKTPFDKELEAIRQDPSIHEVILSGGDPLSLDDEMLKDLLQEIDAIDHIKLVRFHTRFLLGIPERVTPSLLSTLEKLNTQVIFIMHTNHPKELDEDILKALDEIKKIGIPILTQTVLLQSVNDDIHTLKTFFLHLVSSGIIPYYLHALDPIQGARHFDLPVERGITLINELRKQLPGYAVPQFVKEIPGELNKTLMQ